MGKEIVKAGNSIIHVNDKRAASNAAGISVAQAEGTSVLRMSEHKTAYSLMDPNARRLLASDLQHVIDFVFETIPPSRQNNWVYQQKDYLMEAAGLLAKESNGTLLVRQSEIQRKLDKFFDLINKVHVYATMQQDFLAELFVSNSLKRYIKSLNNLTNIKLSVTEFAMMSSIDLEIPLYFILDSSKLDYSPVQNSLTHQQNSSFKRVAAQAQLTAVEEKKKQEAWLASLSPDLSAAYIETEDRIEEVTPLVDNPEDEYFIEQIQSDYYPHIFASLRNLTRTEADFSSKESVVVESIKQFKIIQLGLQRIMEGAVARNLNSIRSQTDFLMNKVLGNNALTLTPEKQNETLEATLEEAQRVREELYKKHVAPVLAKNKQEYETQLATQKEAAKVARDEYKTELSRAENIHQKTLANVREKYKDSLAHLYAAQKQQISDLNNKHRKEMDYLTREAATNHNNLLKKYLELQRMLDGMESPDHYAKTGEGKRLEEKHRQKLASYQVQISNLNDQIHELEALTVSLFAKAGNKQNSAQAEQGESAEEMAERYAIQPPATSIPSVWHTGEDYESHDEYQNRISELYALRQKIHSEDYDPPVGKLPDREWMSLLAEEEDDSWLFEGEVYEDEEWEICKEKPAKKGLTENEAMKVLEAKYWHQDHIPF